MPGMATASFLTRLATPGDMPTVGRLGALLVDQHHPFDAQRFIARPAVVGGAERRGSGPVRADGLPEDDGPNDAGARAGLAYFLS
jgi:hypothetical protein